LVRGSARRRRRSPSPVYDAGHCVCSGEGFVAGQRGLYGVASTRGYGGTFTAVERAVAQHDLHRGRCPGAQKCLRTAMSARFSLSFHHSSNHASRWSCAPCSILAGRHADRCIDANDPNAQTSRRRHFLGRKSGYITGGPVLQASPTIPAPYRHLVVLRPDAAVVRHVHRVRRPAGGSTGLLRPVANLTPRGRRPCRRTSPYQVILLRTGARGWRRPVTNGR